MRHLDEGVLAVLLPGFTHHVDIGQAAEATISYLADGIARMTVPGRDEMTGRWHLLPAGYHVAWEGGPTGDWAIAHEPGRLVHVDPTGRAAGHVTRIAPLPR
jgi:hypothetical protein